MLGCAGTDELGRFALGELSAFGVAVDGIALRDRYTRRIAHLIAHAPDKPAAHRFDTTCPACSRRLPTFHLAEVPEVLSGFRRMDSSSNTVLVIDRANAVTLELARRVNKGGGTVVFDAGYLPDDAPLVRQVLREVAVLKYATDLDRRAMLSEWAGQDCVPRFAFETLADKGVRVQLRAPDGEVHLPRVASVTVQDAGGAGDAFVAGVLLALEGELAHGITRVLASRVLDAARFGQALAALACAYRGAQGPLRYRSAAEIRQIVATTLTSGHVDAPDADASAVFTPLPPLDSGMCDACRLPREPAPPTR
jgi:sugar/nucleoside kinase (ribokinase family)